MLTILFTKSESLLSKVIRKVTREPVSHCAVQCGKWVIHSNLLGVQVLLLSTFEKSCEILYRVPVPATTKQEALDILAKDEHKSYDFGALLYIGLRCLLPFLPKKNLWQSSGMFLCTELVTEILGPSPDSMITPYQLYSQLMHNSSKE